MIDSFDIIDALAEQITALLDLLQGCNKYTDIRTVNTASEMTLNMFEDIMVEVGKIREVMKSDSSRAEESCQGN